METLLLISLNILWVVVLANLILTLRVIRWVKATNEMHMLQYNHLAHPELVIGTPAPEFKARTISGRPIRLDEYVGRSVAFIFLSPRCGHCRNEIPMISKLGPLAQKNAGVEIVLASYEDSSETQSWLDTIRTEDGIDITLSVLVAPHGKYDFLEDYNPSGLLPGFCLLSDQGIVQAHGPIPSAEWRKLRRNWEGLTRLSPFMLNQYR